MPGPCSAPNGDASLVYMSGKARAQALAAKKLITGKTRAKREKEGRHV